MKKFLLILVAVLALGAFYAPVADAKSEATEPTITSACDSCHVELAKSIVSSFEMIATVEMVGGVGGISVAFWPSDAVIAYKKPRKDYNMWTG